MLNNPSGPTYIYIYIYIYIGDCQRVSAYRLNASTAETRRQALAKFNKVVTENPIIMELNADESAAGAHNTKDKQKDRALKGYVTTQSANPTIPSAEFDHLTHVAALCTYIENIHSSDWKVGEPVRLFFYNHTHPRSYLNPNTSLFFWFLDPTFRYFQRRRDCIITS